MRKFDLTDTDYGEGKGQRRGCSAKSLSFVSVCLWVHKCTCLLCNFRGLIRRYAGRNPHKSPTLSLNQASVKLMQHSSLPLPLISCFHTRHVYSWPSLIEVIQPSRCQTRGVLSLSLSSGCDSGSTLIPLPSIPSSASQPDRGLREYRCRIITGLQLYESMEHAANITPCNTLPRQHPRICP